MMAFLPPSAALAIGYPHVPVGNQLAPIAQMDSRDWRNSRHIKQSPDQVL
jgi:hypothetical protein